jgi:aconitate hydratase
VRGLACTEPGSYPRTVTVEADGVAFRATVGLDTEREQTCHRHGGIMPYVLRNLLR